MIPRYAKPTPAPTHDRHPGLAGRLGRVYTRKRRDTVRARIEKALRDLRKQNAEITISSVSRRAGVTPQEHLPPRRPGGSHPRTSTGCSRCRRPTTARHRNQHRRRTTGPADRQRHPDRRTQSRPARTRPHHRDTARRTRTYRRARLDGRANLFRQPGRTPRADLPYLPPRGLMKFRRRNSENLADLICGNLGSSDPGPDQQPPYFPYRSSSYITEFFAGLETSWVHDGSTRHRWVADVIDSMLDEPHDGPGSPAREFLPPHRSTHGPARCPQRRR
jgi:hypothetical protein